MYNIRYHIASLVSVFLALAIGLFLGAAIVDQGAVEQTGAALVKTLRDEFDTLRTENSALSAKVDQSQKFEEYLVGEWSRDRLSGKTVLAVVGLDTGDALDQLRTSVESAGGSVAILSIDQPGFGAETLTSLTQGLVIADPTEDNKRTAVASLLLMELSTPTAPRPTLDALVAAKSVSVEGIAPETTIYSVVDLASAKGVADAAGIELALAAIEAGKTGFAARAEGVETDIIDVAAEKGLTTLDALDGVRGTQAVVTLCVGGVPVERYGLDAAGVYKFPQVVR